MPENFIYGNRYLTQAETDHNAELILAWFWARGWSANAICAMLGNMQWESGANPGIWNGLDPDSQTYGLVQWYPYTKYSNWWGPGWENNGYAQCARIQYEANNNIQWGPNEVYGDPPFNFSTFTTATDNLEDLTWYWLVYYERPGDEASELPRRYAAAERFHNMFIGKLPVWLLCHAAKENGRWLKL